MTKSLATFAGLALATSVTFGQTSLLPVFPGESILNRGGGRGVKLPHNECDTIAQEVQEQEFLKLLLRILKLPEDTALRYRVWQCNIQVSTFGLKKEDADSLAAVLSEYVHSRGSGHTARYALDSLRQRLMQAKPETNGFRATLFETFPHLPRDWVKEDPFQSATLPATNSIFSPQRFVVIDGEIAWTYSVPFGGGRAWENKVDAQELDPKLRPKFEAARQEAEQNLEKRGIKKGFAYVHHLAAEVDAILWQKHQIKRLSFRELNPGIIVD